MYRGMRVAVVVPAFNERVAIGPAIQAIPQFVDHVLVVDDASRDGTSGCAARCAAPRVEIVRHRQNLGVGAAIVTGYRRALTLGVDAVAVMAGDGQMDPHDLPALLDPIADGRADYSKGNRFAHSHLWRAMPWTRIVGNIALSLATKLTSGYWRLFDSQCGYTAISRDALRALDLERVFPRYGYPNDLLARLGAMGARAVDVPVRPIYGDDWKSGIGLRHVIYPIAWVLARSWIERVTGRMAPRALRDSPESV